MKKLPTSKLPLGPEDFVDAAAAGVAKLEERGVKLGRLGAIASYWRKSEGVRKVGATAIGTGAAVGSATALTVSATSGAGITTVLAAAGLGGGMAAAPAALAGGPAWLGAKVLNSTVFKHAAHLPRSESEARAVARRAPNLGASAGVLGVGATTIAGGASGAAIMSTLATVGSVVGGGALVGTAVLVAAPIAVAGATGYAVYKYWGGGQAEMPNSSDA